MSFGPSFNDIQPITWWKRLPVYATTLLTVGFGIGLIVSVLLLSARAPLEVLTFSPRDFSRGLVWQVGTYPFVEMPSFFTLLGMLCFYSWGLEIEKYLGRARYFALLGLVTVAPVIVSLILLWVAGLAVPLAGNYFIVVALLIGFATLYPNIEYFGWIPLKWFAFACVVLGSLMHFPNRDWIGLGLLWMSCALSFGYIRSIQRGASYDMPEMPRLFRKKPRIRVLPDPRDDEDDSDEARSSMPEVDALLDKIAKSGIGSLTAKERQKLEQAREELLRRESPRR